MSNELPVFSPSSTKAFDFCPKKAMAEKQFGYTPTIADKALQSRIAGSAFHVGAAVLHTHLYDTLNGTRIFGHLTSATAVKLAAIEIITQAIQAATLSFKADYTAYISAGGIITDQDYQQGLDKVTAALKKYPFQTPVLRWESITSIEDRLPEAGNCIIDTAGMNDEGIPIVADLKFSLSLESYAITRRAQSYKYDWGLYHYVWAKYPNQACEAMIILVVASPSFKIQTVSWDITPARQAAWLSNAGALWSRMAVERTLPLQQQREAATHADMYGPCSLLRWCQDLQMEGTLPSDIIQVNWPKPVESQNDTKV